MLSVFSGNIIRPVKGIGLRKAYQGQCKRKRVFKNLETILKEDFARELDERKKFILDELRDKLEGACLSKRI